MKNWMLLLLVLLPPVIFGQLLPKSLPSPNAPNGMIPFYEFRPADYKPQGTGVYKHPLIISLHGIGERGNGSLTDQTNGLPILLTQDIPKFLAAGASMQFDVNGKHHSFVVLAPQLSNVYGGWVFYYIDEIIDYAIQNLNIDPDKIFLTGHSVGGFGAWDYPSSSADHARRIAGIFPNASGPTSGDLCNIAHNKVAVWAFHGIGDPVIGEGASWSGVNGVNSCGADLPALITLYPFGGHVISDYTYDTTHVYQNPNVYEWMIGVTRSKNLATNKAPVAVAKYNDQVINSTINLIAPVNYLTLHGADSYDPDNNDPGNSSNSDVIVIYEWSKISGPGIINNIQSPKAPVTMISNLELGVYQFKLKVTDYVGASSEIIITVEVSLPVGINLAPIVNAGPDITITDPNITIFEATAFDWEGSALSFDWKWVSGPVATGFVGDYTNTRQPSISGLTHDGQYLYEFSAFDQQGGVGKDYVVITRKNGIASGPLPVDIMYFKGKNIGESNILTWRTANEVNTDHYEILRSKDGRQYLPVGNIASVGNSVLQEYTFTDQKAPMGVVYYRLKQVDKDSKFKFTNVITVNNIHRVFVVEKYPNPVSDRLNLVIEGNVYGVLKISINDMQGRLMATQSIRKQQSTWKGYVDTQQLSKGVYSVEVKASDGKKEISTFIKK